MYKKILLLLIKFQANILDVAKLFKNKKIIYLMNLIFLLFDSTYGVINYKKKYYYEKCWNEVYLNRIYIKYQI